MDIIVEKGCGLDVHKETVVACIMGTGIKKEVRTYTAMTNDLLRLKGWLQEAGVTHVAMESTGVYWKPVFNILEDNFEVILVNARHVKNVPGTEIEMAESLFTGFLQFFHAQPRRLKGWRIYVVTVEIGYFQPPFFFDQFVKRCPREGRSHIVAAYVVGAYFLRELYCFPNGFSGLAGETNNDVRHRH